MGKRKRDIEADKEHLLKKIRKYNKKLEKFPQEQTLESHASSLNEIETGPSQAEPSPNQDVNSEDDHLPEEFLLALGSEGEEKTDSGDPIRSELALRWSKLINEGLGKETKYVIIKKYPLPSNFPRAEAPSMNNEILASLSNTSIFRDRRIISRQNLTGKVMTCLGRSLTNLLKGDINTKVLIEQINDAAKLAAEIFYQDTQSRKFFALSGVNKTVQEAIKRNKTDEFLFGVDCSEKIKSAQSAKKTGTQIKMPTEPSLNKQLYSTKKTGNWNSPSEFYSHRARGGHQHQINRKQPRYNQQRGRKRPPQKSRPQYRN